MCHSNPHQGIPSTTVTAYHMTQGRVEYESTIPRGTDEGLDLWEASIVLVTHLLKYATQVSTNSKIFVQA